MAAFLLDLILPGAGTLLALAQAAHEGKKASETSELVKQASVLFDSCDKNRDGCLTASEQRECFLACEKYFKNNRHLVNQNPQIKKNMKILRFFAQMLLLANGNGNETELAKLLISLLETSVGSDDVLGFFAEVAQTASFKKKVTLRTINKREFLNAAKNYHSLILGKMSVNLLGAAF